MNFMRIYRFLLLFVPLVLLQFSCQKDNRSGIFQISEQYPVELQQLHRNVLIHILEDAPDLTNVENLIVSLSAEGSWADIDYTSKQRGAWQPRAHLLNLLQISIAYHTEGTPFYQKKEVSKKIHLALNYWLDNDFMCPNWWYPVIGVPMVLNPIMILMEQEVSDDQMQKALIILNRCEIGKTGQNKVWQSGNVLLTSLLTKDIELVKKASASIQEELVVSLGEGVQPDWSYHQHGPQLQFGNYGLSYVADMIKWISILRETSFAFDERKVSILRNYLLEGQRWVVWKNQMDISACGRQLFIDSPVKKAKSLARSITKMESLDSDFAETYQKANDYLTLSGNKHFWRSDIQIQRANDYYFSVKMCSERVIGAESCNSENIQGYYMGDGATFLYQSGEEYRNIFPFLDWKKIPGTTTQQDDDPLPVLTSTGYRIESDLVGGVSDGEHGIAVLDYDRNGLKARKSWFMFKDKIVCLGTGISSRQGQQVTTGVNQSFLNGPVILHAGASEHEVKGSQKIVNPSWVLHDNIGYLFPKGGILRVEAMEVEGSWNWVAKMYPDERIHKELFKLWFDHGVNPVEESYAYILVPQADGLTLNEMHKKQPFSMVNQSDRQEVIAVDGSIAGIVFYTHGKSTVFGGIEVDQACVLMLKKHTDGIKVAVADPTQKLDSIQLVLHGKYSGEYIEKVNDKTTMKIGLPKNGAAGNTVQVTLVNIK